jgi:hypothetical protein
MEQLIEAITEVVNSANSKQTEEIKSNHAEILSEFIPPKKQPIF